MTVATLTAIAIIFGGIFIIGALLGSIVAYLILEYVPGPYNDILIAVIIVALIICSAYAWITY